MPVFLKFELFTTIKSLRASFYNNKIYLFRISFWADVMGPIRENSSGYTLVPASFLLPHYPYKNIMYFFFKE